jgi:hypothetical protein
MKMIVSELFISLKIMAWIMSVVALGLGFLFMFATESVVDFSEKPFSRKRKTTPKKKRRKK